MIQAPLPARRPLTLRVLLVGVPLSLLITAYSAWAGLKVGGVYWPIATATLLAMAILRLAGGAGPQEANVAATAASTGGLLAAGVVFTVPAAWLLGVEISGFEVTLVALVGGLLGVLFTLPLRAEMIERLALPYPDGIAAARMLEAGDEGGAKVRLLLAALAAAGLFAALRDGAGWLPAVVGLDQGGAGLAKWLSLGASVSLVPLAGGFLIGPRFTGAWLAGGATAWWLALPLLVAGGRFADKGAAVAGATRPFGIGVIVGASLAFFLLSGLPALGPLLARRSQLTPRRTLLGAAAAALLAALVAVVLALPLWLGLVAVLASLAVAYVAARIAGELNIDPMEIFAVAILLALLLVVELPVRASVMLAAVLCLAAGMAGDFLQDLKAGHLVGTPPRDQAIAQVVSVVVTAPVLGLVLEAIRGRFTLGSVDLPAPQAVALAALIDPAEGGASTFFEGPLGWGLLAGGLALALAQRLGAGLLPIAFGIGLYAPIELSLPLFLGGLVRAWADRRGLEEPGRLLAAGAIAGEGLVGVGIALWGFLSRF
ncbi:MAG TPA: OPT/YSL family transporter [Thermoanaerobaculia bacterium]|nr:OPT/YSL family transporter [Thermoanaerobaculia bacterium]